MTVLMKTRKSLNKLITLKKSTDNVSDMFLNMGVTGLNVSVGHNYVTYNAKTEKDFNLNGENVDLSNYSVILKDGKISLASNPNFELTIYQNQPYIVSPSIQDLQLKTILWTTTSMYYYCS